jgi:flagellar biosynthesis protein FlhG
MNRLTGRTRLPAEPRICAIAGGAGGIGRSTLAGELGRTLARKGRRVLIVDADPTNPTHLTRFGVQDHAPQTRLTEEVPLAGLITEGDRSRPDILTLAWRRARPFTRVELRPHRLLAKLRALDYHLVIIDLPAHADPVWTGLFVESDVPILVAATEASSLHAATRYLRHTLVHAVLHHPDADARRVEIEDAVDRLPPEFEAVDLDRVMEDVGAAALLREVRDRFESYLLLTRTREVAERELVAVVSLVWQATLGHRPKPLGAVDQDERRWFHLRQDETAGAMNADGGFGQQIDAISKILSDIDTFDAKHPKYGADDVTAIFGVTPGAPAPEIRQAYRRLWEGLRRESTVTRCLLEPGARERLVRTLEEANREVQVWLQERSTDDDPPPKTTGRRTNHPGENIRAARVAADLGLREVSLRTRIGLRYIEAIETFDVEAMPRPVYLRGYLREIARCLELDSAALMDEYLTAVSEARTERILTRDRSEP